MATNIKYIKGTFPLSPSANINVKFSSYGSLYVIKMAHPSEKFQTFFSIWLNRQETLLKQLLLAIAPENAQNTTQHINLVDVVLSHYKVYYQEKGNASKEDPFLFLNPTWLSAFKRTQLWLGDFKPSVIFRLIDNSVTDLTPQKGVRIQQMKGETRREERALTETMARIQESLASPPILNLTRRFGRLLDGEVSEMEAAVEMLKTPINTLLASADVLRGSTVGNVLEILNPIQAVRFFAAAIDFQLRMRRWGQQRDA